MNMQQQPPQLSKVMSLVNVSSYQTMMLALAPVTSSLNSLFAVQHKTSRMVWQDFRIKGEFYCVQMTKLQVHQMTTWSISLLHL